MSVDFSIQDSEDLIAGFKDITDGPHADIAAALRELSVIPTHLKDSKPPLLPSQVVITTIPSNKTHRVGFTTLIVVGLVATATFSAAAFVGVPRPIEHFAKSSVAIAQKAVRTIAHVVVEATKNITNTNDSKPDLDTVDDSPDSNSDAPIENQEYGDSKESSPSPSKNRIESETTNSVPTTEMPDSEGSNIEPDD